MIQREEIEDLARKKKGTCLNHKVQISKTEYNNCRKIAHFFFIEPVWKQWAPMEFSLSLEIATEKNIVLFIDNLRFYDGVL